MGQVLIFNYGLLAGLATTLGALLFLVIGQPDRKAVAFSLGLAAGVMLAVVVIDLFPSAWRQTGGGLKSSLGFAGGWIMIWWADRLLGALEAPKEDKTISFRRLGILTALGIAFHDLPEGMAIALGYETAERLGSIVAVAIGIHNIPEGIATAAPLRAAGVSPTKILGLNLLLAMVTPLGTGLGTALVQFLPEFFAGMLGLASGTMIYLVVTALVPSSCRLHLPSAAAGTGLGIFIIYFLNLIA